LTPDHPALTPTIHRPKDRSFELPQREAALCLGARGVADTLPLRPVAQQKNSFSRKSRWLVQMKPVSP